MVGQMKSGLARLDAQTIALKGQYHSAQGNALGYISPPQKNAP